MLQWVIENVGTIVVPAPILVECTTGDGGRDAEVNRVLGALETSGGSVESTSTEIARLAGALRYRARTDDGIDAIVAAAAARDGATTVLLTSDPHDLERLLANCPQVHVIKV